MLKSGLMESLDYYVDSLWHMKLNSAKTVTYVRDNTQVQTFVIGIDINKEKDKDAIGSSKASSRSSLIGADILTNLDTLTLLLKDFIDTVPTNCGTLIVREHPNIVYDKHTIYISMRCGMPDQTTIDYVNHPYSKHEGDPVRHIILQEWVAAIHNNLLEEAINMLLLGAELGVCKDSSRSSSKGAELGNTQKAKTSESDSLPKSAPGKELQEDALQHPKSFC